MGWFNIYAYIKIVSSRTACATKQNFFKKEKKEKNEHPILIWDWQWQSSKMHNTQSIETIIISGKITMLSQIIL